MSGLECFLMTDIAADNKQGELKLDANINR